METKALITLHEIDGQPLVHDEDLGRELGYTRAEKIRELIQRHQMELLDYGGLPQFRVNPGPKGGRPTYAYYLNEEQALLLCMFSGAEKAKEIRREVITVYQAWRKGKLQPAMPDFNDPIAAATAWLEQAKLRRDLEGKVAKDAPKVENWEAFQNTEATITSSNLAKSLGFRSAQHLNTFLHEHGIIFPRKDRHS